MKFAILTSDKNHPIVPKLEHWLSRKMGHTGRLYFAKSEVESGDLLFLVSCHEIVGPKTREKFKHTLVLHASPLPKGRGWSPHIWQVIEGASELTCSLLEAAEPVDSGPIWLQRTVKLQGHELYDEINEIIFSLELELMDQAIEQATTIQPKPQSDTEPTWYRRRTPADSQIDPQQSLASQFNVLRVADPNRFPAYFTHNGHRYNIRISKAKGDTTE